MKRVLPILLLLAMACPAMAGLCKRCSERMMIMNMGKCVDCGARTTSGAKKLCPACSKRLGQCEVCRVAIGKPTGAPKPKPAAPVFKEQSWNYYNKNIAVKKSVAKVIGKTPFIHTKADFEKVWTLLREGASLPKIDWKKEIVLYHVVSGSNVLKPMTRNTKGVVKAKARSTRRGGPGFSWLLVTYPRKGVKTVNGVKLPVCGKVAPASKTIKLTDASNGKTVAVNTGDKLVLTLKSNPTTGYNWLENAQPADSALKLVKSFYTANAKPGARPSRVGGGGVKTFVYKAVKSGSAEIEIGYKRAWQKDKAAEKTFKMTVTATPADLNKTAITGQIFFKNKTPMLGKITRIVVQLRNVARMDARAPLLGEAVLKGPFGDTIEYSIPFDAKKNKPGKRYYAVSARVYTMVDGKERGYFWTDTRHSVWNKAGDTKKDITVVWARVTPSGPAPKAKAPKAKKDLCDACADMMVVGAMGKCSSCGGHTSSSAYKICKKCSHKQGKCKMCLKKMH